MAEKPRNKQSGLDMVYSMATVAALIAIILVITWRGKPDPVKAVDWKAQVSAIAGSTAWPILAPAEVPVGWTATSARYEHETYGTATDMRWILGFVTSENKYVSVWKSSGPATSVIVTATNDAECETKPSFRTVWRRCEVAKPETRSLVKTDGPLTVVVSGDASWTELESFATSLREQ